MILNQTTGAEDTLLTKAEQMKDSIEGTIGELLEIAERLDSELTEAKDKITELEKETEEQRETIRQLEREAS